MKTWDHKSIEETIFTLSPMEDRYRPLRISNLNYLGSLIHKLNRSLPSDLKMSDRYLEVIHTEIGVLELIERLKKEYN